MTEAPWSSDRPWVAWGIAGAASIALIAGVALAATWHAAEPARCAAGMTPMGARCCGVGQRLSNGLCTGAPERCAKGLDVTPEGCVAPLRTVRIEGGTLHVGPGDWEAQGVVPPREATLASFAIDVTEVTEAAWKACADAGACPRAATTGEPGRAVAGVTFAEASAFCRWSGGALPTSDQLAFAAAGRSSRRYAWGDTGAVCRRAAWGLVRGPCGRDAAGPEVAGSHPDGASPEGVLDLAGNVAEWAIGEGGKPEVRGGSFASSAASELRTWQSRVIAPHERLADIGFRCVHP